jgi:hypothetical protein
MINGGQCLSSVNALVKRTYWDGGRKDPLDSYISTVFPFVVVPNGRLWTVLYDENGNRTSDPIPSDRCSCFINKDYKMGTELASTHMWMSHLEIVTFNGMRAFVEKYLTTKDGMSLLCPKAGVANAYS